MKIKEEKQISSTAHCLKNKQIKRENPQRVRDNLLQSLSDFKRKFPPSARTNQKISFIMEISTTQKQPLSFSLFIIEDQESIITLNKINV